MSDAIGKKHTYGSLLLFLLPTIIMQIILSLYTIVDGMFVSRFVSHLAVSAINICLPIIYLYMGIGAMLGAGGSSVVSRLIGEGKKEEANRVVGLVMGMGTFFACLVAVIALPLLTPIHTMVGANSEVLPYCNEYGGLLYLFCLGSILKATMDCFIVVAGKPKFGIVNSLVGGVTNIVLDYVFIVVFDWGIAGAAIGTILGNGAPTLLSIWLLSKEGLSIRIQKPIWSLEYAMQVLKNGSSQFITYAALGVTTYLYNLLIMHYASNLGVAAMTIVMYIQFITISIHTGFSGGIMPLIAYQYGAESEDGLVRIFKQSVVLLFVVCGISFVVLQMLNPYFVEIFVNKGEPLYELALRGMNIANFGFCFAGINVFGSALFAGLNNGKTAVFLSAMRNFVFVLLGMLLLPSLFHIDGVWLVFDFAEIVAFFITFYCIYKGNEQYMYWKGK